MALVYDAFGEPIFWNDRSFYFLASKVEPIICDDFFLVLKFILFSILRDPFDMIFIDHQKLTSKPFQV